mgnify:CR=1 FL=1
MIVVTVLLLLAITLGLYLGIRNIHKGKKDEGWSSFFISSGVSLVAGSFNAFQSLLKGACVFLAVFDGGVEYSVRLSQEQTKVDIAQLVVGLFFVGLGVWFWYYNKHRLYVLNISGYFPNRIEDRFSDLKLGQFEFKEREIDLIDDTGTEMTASKSDRIVSLIERNVNSFREQSNGYQIGYTGIAPIPFIAMAGTYLKRVRIAHYYEFDKRGTEKFARLGDTRAVFPALIEHRDEESLSHQPHALVIAISTKDL